MSDPKLLPSQSSGKYYIQDTSRGYVGNSMVWWRRGHHGYTCDIREAHVFEWAELPKYLGDADDLVAYPVEHINPLAQHHVDMQDIDRALGLRRPLQQEGSRNA